MKINIWLAIEVSSIKVSWKFELEFVILDFRIVLTLKTIFKFSSPRNENVREPLTDYSEKIGIMCFIDFIREKFSGFDFAHENDKNI